MPPNGLALVKCAPYWKVSSAVTVYTVGHSNRAVHELIAVLDSAGIETLVDVRAFPQSKRHAHFDREPLQEHQVIHLVDTGSRYDHRLHASA